jgi:hypothetical protein
MAEGIASGVADDILDYYTGAGAPTSIPAFYVKLHLGAPGAAGTSNPAAETTRQAASFAAASGGSITTDADTTWTGVSNTETVTHVSFWTASSGGTFLGSDSLDSPASLSAGGDFTIAAGDIDLSLGTVAS